ncbi:MAG: hypothetical protein ACRBG0_27600 [Lewinella sp.]|uniref:hypothetical protein n=1 Tax=Lewinella sp. TaxID=2004506 RepID=UPI003D6BCAF4
MSEIKYINPKDYGVTPVKRPLSDTPSIAIRQAIADAKAVLKSKNAVLDMKDWCSINLTFKACEVCQAGAIALRRGLAFEDAYSDPVKSFENETNKRILAFDNFRLGNIDDFLYAFGIYLTTSMYRFVDNGELSKNISDAAENGDWEYYFKCSLEMANRLEKLGY